MCEYCDCENCKEYVSGECLAHDAGDHEQGDKPCRNYVPVERPQPVAAGS